MHPADPRQVEQASLGWLPAQRGPARVPLGRPVDLRESRHSQPRPTRSVRAMPRRLLGPAAPDGTAVRSVPVAVEADRSPVGQRSAGRSRTEPGELVGPACSLPAEAPAAAEAPAVQGVPEAQTAAVRVGSAGVGPASVAPARWEHPVPDALADESFPGEPARDPRRVPDEWQAAVGFPDEPPRAGRGARAARPVARPGRPVRRWVRACCQAGWECSLTTPSLHRLRCPRHPVRSHRRCARLRAVCRLHRDSSTARPWSVGRLSELAWQQSE